MAGKITLTIDGLAGIKQKAKALENTAFARPMMGDIGFFAMRQIKARTILGEDVDGVDFKPYNPFYAKERAKDGYQVNFVDLTRTGSMLSAMTAEYDRNSVDIFFMNTTDSSGARNPEKAFFLNEDREFFALNQDDIKGIMKIVRSYYQKLIDSKG